MRVLITSQDVVPESVFSRLKEKLPKFDRQDLDGKKGILTEGFTYKTSVEGDDINVYVEVASEELIRKNCKTLAPNNNVRKSLAKKSKAKAIGAGIVNFLKSI